GGEKSTCRIDAEANRRQTLPPASPHPGSHGRLCRQLDAAADSSPATIPSPAGATMKFVTFRANGAAHVGATSGSDTSVVDLTEAGLATSMLDLIERFD